MKDTTALDPAEAERYSIRIAEHPGTPCVVCGEATGSGPVGYRDEDPICDRDLLEGCNRLGMVMALVAVSRVSAVAMAAHPEDAEHALREVGAFARLYERFAAQSGPLRMFRLGLH